jgi:hypothetical protein
MHDLAGSSDIPLNQIPYERLNPGSDMLKKIQSRMR